MELLIKQLEPMHINNILKKEEFEDYYERTNGILPNWPKEVYKEWIYKEYSEINVYSWLDFTKFKFTLEKWNNEDIYNKINSHKMKRTIDPLGEQILGSPFSFLQKFIHEKRTWPSPIIIFKNNNALISEEGDVLGTPYHLLEGHLRLGYFRTLYKNNLKLNEEHLIYIAEVIEKD